MLAIKGKAIKGKILFKNVDNIRNYISMILSDLSKLHASVMYILKLDCIIPIILVI